MSDSDSESDNTVQASSASCRDDEDDDDDFEIASGSNIQPFRFELLRPAAAPAQPPPGPFGSPPRVGHTNW